VESREDLPPGEQSGLRYPVDHTASPVRDKSLVPAFEWPYPTVLVPCLVALAAAGLIVGSSLAFQPTATFELARSAVAWVQADRAGQVAAGLGAAALLVACARRPRWRRAMALTMWGVVPLQIGLFLLSGSQYPGNSCTGQPGWATVTLSDSSRPVVSAPPGALIVATVPGGGADVTGISAGSGAILKEDCTISLPGGGRRAIFTASKPGTTTLFSTVPPSPAAMPAWLGEVIVR